MVASISHILSLLYLTSILCDMKRYQPLCESALCMMGTQEILDEPEGVQKGVKAENMVYGAREEMGMSRALHFREAAGP